METQQTAEPPARAWSWPVILLAAYVAASVARVPAILLEGRFWAEEGGVFFRHALGSGWSEVLCYVAPKLGYYNLLSNASVLAASRLVDVEHAPLVTAWIALGVQTLPAAVIACGMIRAIRTVAARGLALLALLLVPPNAETWLNTINGQSYLAIATALLLVADTGREPGRIFRRLVLALAGLSGLVALFFLPLFWLRAWWEREHERVVQASILTLAALVQGMVLLRALGRSERQVGLPIDILVAAVYVKTMLLPLLGTVPAGKIAHPLLLTVVRRGLPALPIVAVSIGALACGLVVYRSRSRDAGLLITAGALALLFGFAGALEQSDLRMLLLHILPNGGERYYLVPNVLFVLGLFVALRTPNRFTLPLRLGGAVMLVWILLVGANDYVSSRSIRADTFVGPPWQREVAA